MLRSVKLSPLLLLVVLADGQQECNVDDLFPNGRFTTAAISAGCTKVDLSYNNIGDDGAIALAEALENNTALEELSVGNNIIGDTGATALAEALETNIALKTLWLYSNNIGDNGAIALANALTINTVLAELYLSENKIGDTGAIALAKALETNTALTWLGLRMNFIRRKGKTALRNMLENNTVLSTSRSIPGTQSTTVGDRVGIFFPLAMVALLIGIISIYADDINAYLKNKATKRRTEREKRQTHRELGRAHPIIIRTLAGNTYTLTDWGLCKDLKVALCNLASTDVIGIPATFELLGDLDTASGSNSNSNSNQKMVDTKYGSDDRERMMLHLETISRFACFTFEFTLVYQGGGDVGGMGVGDDGGSGSKWGVGSAANVHGVGVGGDSGSDCKRGVGASANAHGVTGTAPLRITPTAVNPRTQNAVILFRTDL